MHSTAALHEQVFARVPAALMGKAGKARCAPAVQRGKSSLELAESCAPASKRPLAEPVDALAIKEEPASKKARKARSSHVVGVARRPRTYWAK